MVLRDTIVASSFATHRRQPRVVTYNIYMRLLVMLLTLRKSAAAADCVPQFDYQNRRSTCCAFWCTHWQAAWPDDNPDCKYCKNCRLDCDGSMTEDCLLHSCELDLPGSEPTPPETTPPVARTVSPGAALKAAGKPHPKQGSKIAWQAAKAAGNHPASAGSPADPAEADSADEPAGEANIDAEPPAEVTAYGPISGEVSNAPSAGMAVHYGEGHLDHGEFRIVGNSRAYLVRDHTATRWAHHHYVRLNLEASPLQLTLDLSNVPCGCLACLYLIAMPEPVAGDANYCDVRRRVSKPICLEAVVA